MGIGHIWPDYWIDCSRCDHMQHLGAATSASAEAKKLGWRRRGNQPKGPWICAGCQEADADNHLRCCGTVEPQYNCPETVRAE